MFVSHVGGACPQIVDTPDTVEHEESVGLPLVRPHGAGIVTVNQPDGVCCVSVLLLFDFPEDGEGDVGVDDGNGDDDSVTPARSLTGVRATQVHTTFKSVEGARPPTGL